MINDFQFSWELLENAKRMLWFRMGLQDLKPVKRNIKVSIVDTGFDLSHPYLKKRLSSDMGWSTDGHYHNLEESMLVGSQFGQVEDMDIVSSHGTHIAGIIAQVIDEGAQIIPIRVGSWDTWVMQPINREEELTYINGKYRLKSPFDEAFEKLCKEDIKVVNLSWSLNFEDEILQEQLIYLAESEKLIVLAAGNDGEVLGDNPNTQALIEIATHPRILNRIILVGALAHYDGQEVPASFSNKPNRQAEDCFIWAPGQQIISTVPFVNSHLGLEAKSGTSMAAGVVTGILGQILGENPDLTIDKAYAIVRETARLQEEGLEFSQIRQKQYFIQAQKALDAARQYGTYRS